MAARQTTGSSQNRSKRSLLSKFFRGEPTLVDPKNRIAIPLRAEVTCPHCWHVFRPEECLWVSQHPDLMGDPRLGQDHQIRFLPSRFTVEGDAVDARGFACQGLACPRCHLPVPRALLEIQSVFLSILGAPASGKSYFLATMTWLLRQLLPRSFSLSFGDADPASNRSLNEYEERLFLNESQDRLVALDKTALEGDLYDTVLFSGHSVSYPRPFIFSLRPLDDHPNFKAMTSLSRAICLYDNAGEHFLPGQDTASSPVTRHLALSRVLFFLFDPTQDPRFRRACVGKSDDPQMGDRARTSRQETILLEAADRVRRHTGLAQHARHSRPLVVVVTKLDAWRALINGNLSEDPWSTTRHSNLCALDLERVNAVSAELRAILVRLTPELVSAAEGFAEQVVYIPASSLGRAPEVDSETGLLGIRPGDLRPIWAEVPVLYAMARWMGGIIPYKKSQADGSGSTNDSANGTSAPPALPATTSLPRRGL
jgi:hypothetical protein